MLRDDVRARDTHPRTVWPWVAPLAALSMLTTGCPSEPTQPDPIAGYVLTLRPNITAGADPFVPGADVSLVIQRDGDLDVTQIGTTDDDSLSLPELPLLVAGDRIGILVESAGGSANQWEPELTLGYGQVTLTEDLPTDGSSIELDVFVPPFASVPATGTMDGRTARFHSGVAMGPDGDVFIFGGMRIGLNDTPAATSDIHAVLDIDGGNTVVNKLDVSMPTNTFGRMQTAEGDTYAGPQAVLVDDDDGPLILVTGGRIDWNDPRFNSSTAFLFDPATRDWVRSDEEPVVLNMKLGMSGHRHVRMANGDLLFIGGLFDDAELSTSVLLYEVGQRRFTEVPTGSATSAVYEPGAASLGPLGAIVCGGTDLPISAEQATGTWPAFDSCFRVSYDGAVTPLAPLPEALTFHAMVELSDGRVLVTGGAIGGLPGPAATPGDATDRAWIYDPDDDAWTEVGAMNRARMGHALVALPDGGALVVGGTDAGTAQEGTTGNAVSCWERFDSTSDSFTDGECTGSGEGLWPRIATAPGEGAFALAGYRLDNLGTYSAPAGFGLFATGLP